MVVDVYVKWGKDEAFNRYHVTEDDIYKLTQILNMAYWNNIIEDFYIHEIEK